MDERDGESRYVPSSHLLADIHSHLQFNAFYKDDLSQRILVLFVVACLIIYGNNAPSVEQSLSEGPARAAAIGSYLLAELGIFGSYFFYSFHIKPYRAQLRAHSFAWVLSSAIWIGCIFVDVKSAIAMAVVALALEYGAWMFVYTSIFKRMLRLQYSSALNIEHEIDRFNDFFTLVIGEFLYSIVSKSPAGIGVKIAAGRAVLAVIVAFCFQVCVCVCDMCNAAFFLFFLISSTSYPTSSSTCKEVVQSASHTPFAM
jgi:hypothetical protein